MDKEEIVWATTFRIYPLIYNIVSESRAEEYCSVLLSELRALKENSFEVKSDPLLNSLDEVEKQRLLHL